MMLVTNLTCLFVGVALGMITTGRLLGWLCKRGRCELNIIGKEDKLHCFGFIDGDIIDKNIRNIRNS